MSRGSVEERFAEEADALLGRLADGLPALRVRPELARVGRIVEVADGVATAVGLDQPIAGELLDVAGIPARAEVVSRESVLLVLLGEGEVLAGAVVRRHERILDVPSGPDLLGRVVDALGRPLDGRGALRVRRRIPVDRPPIPLADREPVTRPLRTGTFVIDTMIPVGRGQRQLLIGDRSTGKSELGIDILAALEPEIVGIYVAIGRRGAEVAAALDELRRRDFFSRGLAVVAEADAPIGLVHLAPYTAAALAEDLMLAGRDVVVVFDDLTSHAHAHRTLALLLGRPVGREAYPVDVFYAHARLLERATQLGERRGGGSFTALPVIETQAGDLAAYIPTNLVSITDGQIRMDAGLVAEGHLPAVDVGLSVSRVGGKAQPKVVRRLAGRIKNEYAQFLELETFTRFGAQLESSARRVIAWGQRTRALLRQEHGEVLGWSDSVLRLLLLEHDEITAIPLDALPALLAEARRVCAEAQGDLLRSLDAGRSLDDDDLDGLRRALAPIVEAAIVRDPAPGAEDP
ncbi:MAG: F0F1 ATP synthase subunit alpha [Myxococcales bacterium]|nr:F0F1 ATP synthase subunit alpha [Myxococcales bacterium]